MGVLVRKLTNGVLMPAINFGTYGVKSEELPAVVPATLEAGYRCFDCAWIYENEKHIGPEISKYNGKFGQSPDGIKIADAYTVSEEEFNSNFAKPHGKPVDDRRVFIATKVWFTQMNDEGVRQNLSEHLTNFSRCGTDLLMLHWPGPFDKTGGEDNLEKRLASWKALEKVYAEGKVRAIGVSNFMIRHLETLLADIDKRKAAGDVNAVYPMYNQIELSPWLSGKPELEKYCQDRNIVLAAFRSLGGAREAAKYTVDPVLSKIAEKYNETPAQTILRWVLQRNYIVIAKSSNPARISANFNIAKPPLSEEEMHSINGLNEHKVLTQDPEIIL